MKKRVLILANHRKDRSPGQRFRFEQFIAYLEMNNFQIELSSLIDQKSDTFFYSKGKILNKIFLVLKSFVIRLNDLLKAKQYDLVLIFREALFISSTFFEREFSKRTKTILDFDDAIWLLDVSEGNKAFSWLKKPLKINKTLKHVSMVFAGNKYLATYAKKFNENVVIIPTTIDTNIFKRPIKVNYKYGNETKPITIGWTGSITTLKHLSLAFPVFAALKKKYNDKICFKAIADGTINCTDVDINFCTWNKETEIEDLCDIDIGIMPLPDDEWSKGKCGFKGLQYMALEIPTIMSPVGVNTEIIQDGVNGFLANSKEEWIEKLSLLIESPELREKFGKAGRQTVIERYSFDSQKDKYLHYFKELTK